MPQLSTQSTSQSTSSNNPSQPSFTINYFDLLNALLAQPSAVSTPPVSTPPVSTASVSTPSVSTPSSSQSTIQNTTGHCIVKKLKINSVEKPLSVTPQLEKTTTPCSLSSTSSEPNTVFIKPTARNDNISMKSTAQTECKQIQTNTIDFTPSPTSYWLSIEKHHLFFEDRDAIIQNAWLNDRIMYVSGLLIKKQWPAINGFYTSQLGKTYQFKKTPSPFIQILNIKRSHWIVASTVNCDNGIVNVYDSLSTAIDKDTKFQISSICDTTENTIKIKSVNIQRQTNSRDCGLFSLAVATELAQRKDPRLCYWDVSKMRNHLETSLEKEIMTSFPLAKTRRIPPGSVFKSFTDVELFCTCRMPNDPTRSMIQCDRCKKWFHHKCLGLNDDAELPTFTCNNCMS